MKNTLLLALGLVLLQTQLAAQKPYINPKAQSGIEVNVTGAKPVHTLYLLGNAGDTKANARNPVLTGLREMLAKESNHSSVAFLGDQIYPNGLPSRKKESRPQAELILKEQLEAIAGHRGRTYFIAGEKDWNNGKAKGLKALHRMEKFVEDYFEDEDKVKFYPGKGCGDPKVVKVTKDLVFVFLNTQWWLQRWDQEKDINDHCDIKSRYDLLAAIREIMTEHKNDEVVLMMHHPVRSRGHHGGNSSLYDHIFPFASTHNVAVPLPVIGSLVPIFRNVTGSRQDLANAHYRALMEGIDQIARELSVHTIFASAHDQNLQHFDDGKWQYIISGSASRAAFVGRGSDVEFTYAREGFARITFYPEFETGLEVFALNDAQELELVYETQLRPPRPGTVDEEVEYPALSQKDTIIAASKEFAASGLKETFLGDQYRSTWTTPVRAPLINLEKALGGLTPVKKGGGMASNSLRMEHANGKQYILRSIKKDYRKLVPPEFANLKLLDVLKDQNSASHPYGALVLPKLSAAAGIFYTTPKLVYLKHQNGLGNYNSQFPEELYLLEERPSGNWSDAEQFGNSKEILGYVDVLANLREKKTHFVDQGWVCRSRMFDLLVHDFDRHDDQWRWATFEEQDKTIYRPIPRDRDQVFYRFRGVVPWYIASFVEKKFKTMQGDLKDVDHQSFNARYFDRYFMNELPWSDWVTEIEAL
ncbi:MAG: hypothetical protein KTR24_17385, partial [Saprospiraceae bacterium]|nr:hypothetical protein [Saprospiraceae bacterium]